VIFEKALFEIEIDTKNFSLSSTYRCIKTLGEKCFDYLKFSCEVNKTSPKIVQLKIELGCFRMIHFRKNSLTTFITFNFKYKRNTRSHLLLFFLIRLEDEKTRDMLWFIYVT
jgi:hypothetical protein